MKEAPSSTETTLDSQIMFLCMSFTCVTLDLLVAELRKKEVKSQIGLVAERIKELARAGLITFDGQYLRRTSLLQREFDLGVERARLLAALEASKVD